MSYLDEVIDVARRDIRGWLIDNYASGKKKLAQWDDHRASLIQIHSYNLPGTCATNLRRLKKLVDDGHILFKRRVSGVYCFTLPREQLDVIAAEETKRWEEVGYVGGQMMDAILAKPQPDQPAQEDKT